MNNATTKPMTLTEQLQAARAVHEAAVAALSAARGYADRFFAERAVKDTARRVEFLQGQVGYTAETAPKSSFARTTKRRSAGSDRLAGAMLTKRLFGG